MVSPEHRRSYVWCPRNTRACDVVVPAIPGVHTPGYMMPPHPGLGTCDVVGPTIPGVHTPGYMMPPHPGLGTCDVVGPTIPGVHTPGYTLPPHPGLGTCDVVGPTIPGVHTPGYTLPPHPGLGTCDVVGPTIPGGGMLGDGVEETVDRDFLLSIVDFQCTMDRLLGTRDYCVSLGEAPILLLDRVQHRHDLRLEAPARRPRILRHDRHGGWLRFPVLFRGTELRWREAADRETPGLEPDHAHFLAVIQGNADRLGERERPCFTGIGVFNAGRKGRPHHAVDSRRRQWNRGDSSDRIRRLPPLGACLIVPEIFSRHDGTQFAA
jgi:hypothetical protein